MTEDKTTLFRMPGGMMAELKCHRGSREGETFSLSLGTFVIGRSSGSDLVLAADSGVSKVHAKIIAEEEKYVLLDNESRNGTMVNGKPMTKQTLHHGDEIQICGCRLTFFSLGATGVSDNELTTNNQKEAEIQSLTHSSDAKKITTVEADSPQSVPPQFYSDENAHDQVPPHHDDIAEVDEFADTLQPIDKDTLLAQKEDSDDSMTVTTAMVSDSGSQSASVAMAQVKEALGDVPRETKKVSYQDMHTITGQKSSDDKNRSKAPKQSNSSGGFRSFLIGLLVVLGGYTGWLIFNNTKVNESASVPSVVMEAQEENEADVVNPVLNEPSSKGDGEAELWYEVKSAGHATSNVRSPASGSLSSINVKNGELVFVGQSAVTVANNRLSSDIETIKLEIKALERLAKTNKSEFIQQGLKEERQKLRSLTSQQKRIVKIKNAGTVSGLNKKAGDYVKKGEILFAVSGTHGLPRVLLTHKKEIAISKGMSVEVKSKNGKIGKAQIVFVTKSGSGKILTLKGPPRTFKVRAIRLLKP